MKRRILICLIALLLCVSSCALAQRRPGKRPSSSSAVEEESRPMTQEERQEYLKEEARQDTLAKLRRAYRPKEKDYDQNTVCTFGPQFREVSPRMTDQWYMFTPVDLSRDGTQTFDLIGGSMYVIGKLTVKVRNGTVCVDYAYADSSIESGREYFTIFPDYESISADMLENFHLQKRFTYGRTYSIEEKLGGDTDVILFVCNTATFKHSTPGIVRYYETNEDRVQMREAMLDMIGK